MRRVLFLLAALAPSLFCGCGRTPVRGDIPAAIPPHLAESRVSAARAEAFRKIIAPAVVRGVGIFPSEFYGRYSDAEVLDAAEALGFNRLYCHLTSEKELDERFAGFVAEAVRRNFAVEVVLAQQDFYRRYRGNRLIRGFLIQYPDFYEAMEALVKFDQKLPEGVRLAGVTAVFSPHLFNGDNAQRTYGRLYRWSEKSYGVGGDNDMLMREALELARRIAAIPGLPRLTIAIPDFFNETVKAGKLPAGSLKDFAAIHPRIAVICSANMPSKIPEVIRDELADAPLNTSVIAVIPLAGHTSQTEGRLRRRNWEDFQRSIAFLMRKHGSDPAFGGVIVSPLAVIEFLRREK